MLLLVVVVIDVDVDDNIGGFSVLGYLTKKNKKNADDDDSPELKEAIRLVNANPDLTGDEKSRAELKIRKRYRAELLLNDEDEGERWEMNDEERAFGRGGGGGGEEEEGALLAADDEDGHDGKE